MRRTCGAVRWKLAAVIAGLALAAGLALGQYRVGHGVWIMDPIAGVQNAISYLIARVETLDAALREEVAARQALEREVEALKRARDGTAPAASRTTLRTATRAGTRRG